jgi:hypothetical protein
LNFNNNLGCDYGFIEAEDEEMEVTGKKAKLDVIIYIFISLE